MGRSIENERDHATPFDESGAYGPQRNRWYARFLQQGDPPDEAFRKARDWVFARERFRAVEVKDK